MEEWVWTEEGKVNLRRANCVPMNSISFLFEFTTDAGDATIHSSLFFSIRPAGKERGKGGNS